MREGRRSRSFFIGRQKTKRGERSRTPALARSDSSAGTASVSQRDDENQRRQCADSDPDPLLTGQARRLGLLEVLRELMQVLRRHLSETLIDLLLGEAIGGEHRRDLLVRRD